MNTLETAAKALWDATEATMPERCRMKWEDGTAVAREATLRKALAVLEGVRRPDRTVVNRGTAQLNYDCPVPDDAPSDDDYHHDVRRAFTAMIDAIIAQQHWRSDEAA